jgi:hypothetical protein
MFTQTTGQIRRSSKPNGGKDVMVIAARMKEVLDQDDAL